VHAPSSDDYCNQSIKLKKRNQVNSRLINSRRWGTCKETP